MHKGNNWHVTEALTIHKQEEMYVTCFLQKYQIETKREMRLNCAKTKNRKILH